MQKKIDADTRQLEGTVNAPHDVVEEALSRAPATRGFKWGVLLALTAGLAFVVTLASSPASFEDRLLKIAAQRSVSPQAFRLIEDSPGLQALFLDHANDVELALKMQLALQKFGPSGRRVLEAFGTDPLLQAQLRTYGETVVPVVAYFMDNDIASLRAAYEAARLAYAAKSGPRWLPFGRKGGEPPAAPPVYSAETRGLHAIERIQHDRHDFLGQFDIDPQGLAHWNQTQRVSETLEDFLFGGIRDLERKHAERTPVTLADYGWASLDVFSMIGAVKVMKVIKAARGTGKMAEGASLSRRTTLLARPVLSGERIGKHVIAFGAKAGAVYLVVRHPGLLSSVFAELGEWIGIPRWVAVLLDWWGVATAGALLLLPLLASLGVLIPAIRSIASAARWLWPVQRRSRRAPVPRSEAAPTQSAALA